MQGLIASATVIPLNLLPFKSITMRRYNGELSRRREGTQTDFISGMRCVIAFSFPFFTWTTWAASFCSNISFVARFFLHSYLVVRCSCGWVFSDSSVIISGKIKVFGTNLQFLHSNLTIRCWCGWVFSDSSFQENMCKFWEKSAVCCGKVIFPAGHHTDL